jgi:hypothetical protein
MRPAIPFDIILSPRETEESYVPPDELLGRLTRAFPNSEIDRERGKRDVLQRMQELLDIGTPEIIVEGHPMLAERTSYVAVRWPDWPGNLISGHISGLERELDGLYFHSESHNFAFLKFAAGQLATAFNMKHSLQTPYNKAIETASWPEPPDPLEWIQARYARLDSCTGRYDPDTKTFSPLPRRIPVLQELADWPERLHRGLCHYLEEYRRCNSDAMTHGFTSFEDYATAYVRELDEFSPVGHCWSVQLDQSHHNEVLVDHGEWLTRINLSGVPTGIFESGQRGQVHFPPPQGITVILSGRRHGEMNS